MTLMTPLATPLYGGWKSPFCPLYSYSRSLVEERPAISLSMYYIHRWKILRQTRVFTNSGIRSALT